jgi:hypothetical protein
MRCSGRVQKLVVRLTIIHSCSVECVVLWLHKLCCIYMQCMAAQDATAKRSLVTLHAASNEGVCCDPMISAPGRSGSRVICCGWHDSSICLHIRVWRGSSAPCDKAVAALTAAYGMLESAAVASMQHYRWIQQVFGG